MLVQRLFNVCWLTAAALCVVLALSLSGLRVLLPSLEQLEPRLEHALSGRLGHPVVLGGLELTWRGLGFKVVLNELAVPSQGPRPVLEVKRLLVGFDLIDSVTSGRIIPSQIIAEGATLTVRRDAAGGFDIDGIAPAPAGRSGQSVHEWMAGMARLSRITVNDAHLTVIDEATAKQTRCERFDAELNHRRQGPQFAARCQLAEQGLLRLAANDITFTTTGQPSAALYLRLDELPLSKLAAIGLPPPPRLRGGADANIWLTLDAGRIEHAAARIAAWDLNIQGPPEAGAAFHADTARAEVHFRRTESGWQLALGELQLERNARPWSPGRVLVTAHRETLRVDGDFLRLQDTIALARAFGLAWPPGDLQRLALRGDLHEVSAFVEPKLGIDSLRAEARFADLAVDTRLASASGLAGQLRVDGRSARVRVDSARLNTRVKRLFPWGLSVDRLTGQLAVVREPHGWVILGRGLRASNADLAARVRFRADLSRGRPPHLDLYSHYQRGNLEHLERYLPARIVPAGVNAWLGDAVRAGDLAEGTLLYHGPIKDQAIGHHEARFESRMHIGDIVLDFGPGWPLLEGRDGELAIIDQSLHIDVSDGRVMNTAITQAEVAIDSFREPRLTVRSRGTTPTQDLLHMLTETPLNAGGRYGFIPPGLEGQGRNDFDLTLSLPIQADSAASVTGRIWFRDAALALPDTVGPRGQTRGLSMTELTGRVDLRASHVKADALTFEVDGFPVAAAFLHEPGTPSHRLDVYAHGRWPVELVARLGLDPRPWLAGELPWVLDTRMTLAEDGSLSGRMLATSDLNGTGINLPQPLGKPSDAARAGRLVLPFRRAGAGEPLALGPVTATLEGLGALHAEVSGHPDSPLALQRASLHFGGERAELPESARFRVYGALGPIAWHDWQPVLDQVLRSARDTRDEVAPNDDEITFDVAVEELALGRFAVNRLTVRGQAGAGEAAARVAAEELAGRVRVGFPLSARHPIQIDLERLSVPFEAKDGPKNRLPAPTGIPPISLTAQHLSVFGRPLRNLALTTQAEPKGLSIRELEVEADGLRLRGTGHWRLVEGGEETALEIDVASFDLGRASETLALGQDWRGGRGRLGLRVHWADQPNAMTLGALEGSAEVALERGQIQNLEPGLGRLLGLASIDALPRRLALDFRDLVREGFAFDAIEGSFDIDDGRVHSTDLRIDSPTADIEIGGYLDLVAGTLNHEIAISPEVSGSLPWLGAIAGGLQLGLTLAVVHGLLNRQIDDIAQMRYALTGQLDAPRLKPLAN